MITLVPCNTRCLNMGDVAMLQVAVARLRTLWPWDRICVFTSDPAALLRYCPEVAPVLLPEAPAWCTDRYLGGPLHSWLSERWSDRLLDLHRAVTCRTPRLRGSLITLRAALTGDDLHTYLEFADTIGASRMLVTSGAGGLADHFRDYTNLVLLALQTARARRVPTAMMSHGFGPLTMPDLRAKAAAILPSVDAIAVRETRASVPLLASLGVPGDRVMSTGDDAIALAYEARPAALGCGVGINLRVARSAASKDSDVPVVREGLWRFAQVRPAPLVPLPIARQRDLDALVIRQLIGQDDAMGDGRELDTPLKVIHQVGRCRIVVTGAYHAAVFALAQGVPAVCLARSPYFMDKFLGLADQFGSGCHLVSLDDPDVPARLVDAMEQAWAEAPAGRVPLWQAAARQIERGQAAYQHVHALVEHSRVGRVPGRAAEEVTS
jgi:colanic acid/amylovoran biosynthesis protein